MKRLGQQHMALFLGIVREKGACLLDVLCQEHLGDSNKFVELKGLRCMTQCHQCTANFRSGVLAPPVQDMSAFTKTVKATNMQQRSGPLGD